MLSGAWNSCTTAALYVVACGLDLTGRLTVVAMVVLLYEVDNLIVAPWHPGLIGETLQPKAETYGPSATCRPGTRASGGPPCPSSCGRARVRPHGACERVAGRSVRARGHGGG